MNFRNPMGVFFFNEIVFSQEHTLVEISQNVTIILATTCDY